MNFSNFTKISSGNLIYFRNESPIENVGPLKFYKDNASGTFVKKEFRWSFDRNHWASWMDLNVGNIAGVKTGDNKYLFFEIKYTMTSPTAGKVSSFLIDYLPNPGQTYAPPVEDVNTDHGHTLPDGCNDLGGTVKNYEIIEIKNADTLCGKNCDYYLWRGNHKGTQPISSITDLQSVLNNLAALVRDVDITGALNVDGPGIGVYYGKTDKKLYFKTLIEGNKIFITEDLGGHITIAVDDASINDLFTLVGTLDGANVGGGTGEVFKQRLGQDFQFRTIVAGNANITVTTVGDQIRISLDPSVSGEAIWTDPDPISADVGGLNPGDILDGSTSISVLEKMLYEYFPPEVNLQISPSGVYQSFKNNTYYGEKNGTAYDVSLGGDFNNSPFTKLRIYDASLFINGVGSYSHIPYLFVPNGSFGWEISGPSLLEDRVYSVKIYDNMSFTPTEVSIGINYVFPYLYGVIGDISTGGLTNTILQSFYLAGQKIVAPEQSNEVIFDRPIGISRAKFVYAYDDSYGDLSSIFDVKNDFNVTTSFDKVTINNVLIGTELKTYKVYIKSHWIDVSSFKLIFNI